MNTDPAHPPASVPTPEDHYDSAMFSSAMLARCVLTEAQRKSFIQQSAMSIVNDEKTGARVVAYRHPNGKVLIDEIQLSGERENAALRAELEFEQAKKDLLVKDRDQIGRWLESCMRERDALRRANADLAAALDGVVTSKKAIERAESILAAHAAQKAGGA
jgi:hypothetical protein